MRRSEGQPCRLRGMLQAGRDAKGPVRDHGDQVTPGLRQSHLQSPAQATERGQPSGFVTVDNTVLTVLASNPSSVGSWWVPLGHRAALELMFSSVKWVQCLGEGDIVMTDGLMRCLLILSIS